MSTNRNVRIGIVGPCASGKSTLAARLKQFSYQVRHIAQEHSYVPDMWQRISNPDILIYLHVSYNLTIMRRQLNWTVGDYEEQLRRLAHARQNADITIDTDFLTAEQVLQIVLEKLDNPLVDQNHP